MATFSVAEGRFSRDLERLTDEERSRFERAVRERFVPYLNGESPLLGGLRTKRVQGTDDIWELTWAPNGRATFRYGESLGRGPHIVWLRVGGHEIFGSPE